MHAEVARQRVRDQLALLDWPVWELMYRPGQPAAPQLVTAPAGGLPVGVRVQVGKRPRGVDGPLYPDKARLADTDQVLALVDPATETVWWLDASQARQGAVDALPGPWPQVAAAWPFVARSVAVQGRSG